jgi:hypothetical protein
MPRQRIAVGLGWRISIFVGVTAGVLVVDSLTSANAQSILRRVWDDLVARPGGPMTFRFLLQPIMASLFAIRDGIKDARTGRSPYFWTVMTDKAKRNARLKEGLKATARIIILGLIMDAIYQFRVLGTFYPGEAIIITLLLAFIPYLLLRGPVERIAKRWIAHDKSRQA